MRRITQGKDLYRVNTVVDKRCSGRRGCWSGMRWPAELWRGLWKNIMEDDLENGLPGGCEGGGL